MEIISDEILSKGFLVLFRLLPIIMLIPGGHYIPIKIKVLFSISFSILIALILENNFNSSPELITYIYEGLIGLTIGLSIRILFHAVTIAAQSGLSQATI